MEVDMADIIPRGVVVAYWAQGDNIPAGWTLCDGSHDTPDLRGQFIRGGASLADLTGLKAGSNTHSHSVQVTVGNPTSGLNDNCSQGDNGITLAGSDHHHSGDGSTDVQANVPEHVVLLFIMKL